jgi:nucleoside-diphosphate-sugar epimerase
MNCLVTGAAGFIGSHLCERLLRDGHRVVGLDAFIPYYPRSVKEENLAQARTSPRFEFVEADLRNADLRPLVARSDAIVHEAAMAGLVRSWADLELYASCNLLALGRLLDAVVAEGGRRFLQISTSSVYGREAVGDETLPLRPSSPYGVTKLAAEQLVLAYVENHGIPASVVRYFSIYGPRQRPDMAYHLFAEALLDDRPITIYGDGEQSRSNTHVSDAVRGTIEALDGAAVGEVYNIGGGASITVNRAIEVLARAIGTRPRIVHGPPRPGDQRHTAADTRRAREAFGYVPRVDPVAGLIDQARWHQDRRGETVRSSVA